MSKFSNSPVAIEGLEGRQLMAGTSVESIKIAKASDPTTGVVMNQNRITVNFSKTVRLGDLTQWRSFGYANVLTDPDNQQFKVAVGMTISKVSDTAIQIITDRLIRKGSRLTIAAGGLTDTKGNNIVFDASTASSTITFLIGQNKAKYSLAQRNFVPTDLSYFQKSVFSSAPTAATASTTPSTTTITKRLTAFMKAKLTAGTITQTQYDAALATYNSSAVAGIVPNANLRAALASLYGTVAEPAVAALTTKNNITGKVWSSFDFSSDISADAPVGETKLNSNGRLYTYIQPSFAGEPFQVLSAQVAHEVTRQDAANNSGGKLPDGIPESIIANDIEAVVYAQQLMTDPSTAANGTALVVRENTRLLALVNSGQGRFPNGGILQDQALKNNGVVFSGAKTDPGNYNDNSTVKSFSDWINREYKFRGFGTSNTPMNATTLSILENIMGGTKKTYATFNPTVESDLDTSNVVLNDVAYVHLASILKLAYA